MTTDYKIVLRNIVELFYQPPFKIFNVNSLDGETMIKPFGYFISLGITTSFDALRSIRDFIQRSDYGFEARLVELRSIKSEEYGDYLNILSDKKEEEITKYVSTPPDDLIVYGKEETESLLEDLTDRINKGDYSVSQYRQKLQETYKKIDNWEDYGLQLKDGQLGVFHKNVNYKRDDVSEYRIGIYVTKA